MTGETWKKIPGFGGHYEASNLGRIKALKRIVEKKSWTGSTMKQTYRERMLKPHKMDKIGHMGVHLGVGNKKYGVSVHRLVLLAFAGDPQDGQECCHNNGFAWCNKPSNLRWDSHTENNRDRIRHGTIKRGEKHHYADLQDWQAYYIKYSGRSAAESSKTLGINYKKAWRILRGETWAHI